MALASQRLFASRRPGSRAFVQISVDLAHQTAPVGQNHRCPEAGARSGRGAPDAAAAWRVAARRTWRSLGAGSGVGRRLEPWQRTRLAGVERHCAGVSDRPLERSRPAGASAPERPAPSLAGERIRVRELRGSKIARAVAGRLPSSVSARPAARRRDRTVAGGELVRRPRIKRIARTMRGRRLWLNLLGCMSRRQARRPHPLEAPPRLRVAQPPPERAFCA